MFSVLLYCALIPFVESGWPVNNKSNYSSKRPTIASVVMPKTIKPMNVRCNPQINDSEIAQIVELIKRDTVNVIDLHLISGNDYNNQKFADKQVSFVNLVGREILYIQDNERYHYNTWTLSAGRKSFNLNAKQRPNGCNEDIYDLVAVETLKQIALKIENPKDYEMCSLELETIEKPRRLCCRVTNPDSTNFKHECPEIDSLLYNSILFWIPTIPMVGLIPIYFVRLLNVLFSYTFFKITHSQYYKLQESTLSISSIFVRIFWKEQRCVASHLRRFVLMCVIIGMYFLCDHYSPLPFYVYLCSLVICSVCCTFIVVRQRESDSKIFDDEKSVAVIKELTRPFSAQTLRRLKDVKPKRPSESITECSGKCIFAYIFYLFEIVYFFLYVIFTLCIKPYSYVFYEMANIMMKIIAFDREKNPEKYSYKSLFLWLDRIITISFLTFFPHSCYIFVLTIQSLLLGLVINLVYFIPHLATFSVVTFYSYTIWKSLEDKYLLLKLLIYEACQDNQVNADIRDLEENEKLISVVSKELYSKIRKKVLPYRTNLFWVFLKLLWLSVFSYTTYELVNMLHKFHITAAVQLVVTASISIFPLIFKIVAWNINNEQTKDVWKEELKLNVKHMVKNLTDNNEELGKTFLIQGKVVKNKEQSKDVSAKSSEKNPLRNESSLKQYVTNL
mgnify:FL=1